MSEQRFCTVSGCTGVHVARGYCARHYSRWQRHGSPDAEFKTGSSWNRVHGHSPRGKWSRTYVSWRSMIIRTSNAGHEKYQYYGGRGITICERWRYFENFLADMGERPEGRTLDRIDNDGNYEPGNCRWATQSEQVRSSWATRKKLTTSQTPAAPQAGPSAGIDAERRLRREQV